MAHGPIIWWRRIPCTVISVKVHVPICGVLGYIFYLFSVHLYCFSTFHYPKSLICPKFKMLYYRQTVAKKALAEEVIFKSNLLNCISKVWPCITFGILQPAGKKDTLKKTSPLNFKRVLNIKLYKFTILLYLLQVSSAISSSSRCTSKK